MPDSVEIRYNGEIIASMNSDGSKVLKTGGTIVEHDINVKYTKPSGSAIGNTVNLSTDIVGEQININGAFIEPTGAYFSHLTAEVVTPATALALCRESRRISSCLDT